jgi:hypothetical protein
VYLCQLSAQVSCGACCGLYNIEDCFRSRLEAILSERTRRFASTPRTLDAIDEFQRFAVSRISGNPPYPEFHHCPYIGFVGERHSTVGCLLHPLVKGNEGVDYRGLSFYGGMACRMYFCPAHRVLPSRWKRILKISFNDWYLYGLVVTEHRMVASLFEEIEHRIGRHVHCTEFLDSKDALSALARFFELKEQWPFRGHRKTVCTYFFEDGLYDHPAKACTKLGFLSPRLEIICKSLGSGFLSKNEPLEAESLIERHLRHIVDALTSSC